MKTLYLECGMGAAGDMLGAALLELLDDPAAFLAEVSQLGIPGVTVESEPVKRMGIGGTHLRVMVAGEEEVSEDVHEHHVYDHDHEHDHHHDHDHDHHHDHDHDHHHDHDHEHEHDHDHDHDHHHDHEHDHDHDHEHHHHHHHTSMQDIRNLLDTIPVSETVRRNAKAVFGLIAEAEGKVHGMEMEQIHFHEVGTMDAVTDVLMTCMLMEKLGVDEVVCSPVHVGSGYVRCMHGVLPVPAPATAWILRDVPTYGGEIRGELCTPTGAALLKHFVTQFGERPVMRVEKVGYGMGQKEFERLNCVRAFLGEGKGKRESICRLECNVDDMTGEEIGYALQRLLENGARDAYTIPVGMKKSRPGNMICCICMPEDADALAEKMLKWTSTLGVRREDLSRYVLERRIVRAETPWGPVAFKQSEGSGAVREKAEYDDLARIARENEISLADARNMVYKWIQEHPTAAQ